MSKPWITVTTTLPQSLGLRDRRNGQPEIRTERLVIRPLAQSDLVAFHRLRRQPEFMKHSTAGRPDASIRETQDRLDYLINAPKDPDQLHFPTYFGVFLNTTGELIGDGGVHAFRSPTCGWPELGCKFAREHLGRGYGTEFLRAFTAWWWALPRCRERGGVHGKDDHLLKIRVHPDSVVWDRSSRTHGKTTSVDGGEEAGTEETEGVAVEQLYAWITPDNHASQRMVIKTGLEHFVTWEHPAKKITVMGWRQSRHRRSFYPSKM